MKASITDLSNKMHDVLRALDRKEEVTIFYRGELKGRLLPATENKGRKVQDHEFFGMYKDK